MSVGFCKYCHQGITVDADPGATEEELTALATGKCSCYGATHQARVESVLEEYEQNLELLFNKQPGIAGLLRKAGAMIMDGEIKKITVTQETGRTIALEMKGKGLCITITNKQKEETISYG